MLANLAVERSLFIIADEVYRDFAYDGLPFTSFSAQEEAKYHVVVIDSVSKRYRACGARIGFIVSRNAAVMEKAMKFAQSRGCTPTLEQVGRAASTGHRGLSSKRSARNTKSGETCFAKSSRGSRASPSEGRRGPSACRPAYRWTTPRRSRSG